MTHRPILLAAAFALSTACSSPATHQPPPTAADPSATTSDAAREAHARLAEIERRVGGRLGVALVDGEGRTVLSHRDDERFAMCSTFKLALASMVLDGAEEGRWRLDERLALAPGDILSHSPVASQHVASGFIPLETALAAIVMVSDNGAANLVLRKVGGPAAFTRWLRANGDQETRLDRYELELNENRPGDPRDTTTPRAAAAMTLRMIGPRLHSAENRQRLRGWLAATETGARRIRAGLPAGWEAGDKTGSCGTAWNDIAWFRPPGGGDHVLAVYLDRPTAVRGQEAEAVLAEVARVAAGLVG